MDITMLLQHVTICELQVKEQPAQVPVTTPRTTAHPSMLPLNVVEVEPYPIDTADTTKVCEPNKQGGNPKAAWKRGSWSTSQSECEGLEGYQIPDIDQTLHMLLARVSDTIGTTETNLQTLPCLKNALACLIATLYDASNPQEVPWSHFNCLVTQLKQLTLINDLEYQEIGEEEVGKFRFKALLQASPEAPLYRTSFKPKGTISLNKTLCSLLSQITGPIQLQGKLPIKQFDGPSHGTGMPEIEKMKYKREVSEVLFNHFMSAAESHWAYRSARMRQQLCNHLVGALKLLFLYWGYFLCREQRLPLSDNDREKVKIACQEQLKQNTFACVEKRGTFLDEFPLYIVFTDLVNDSSHSSKAFPSQQRTNSIVYDRAYGGVYDGVYDGNRNRSTSRQPRVSFADEEHHTWGSNDTRNVHRRLEKQARAQPGYYSGRCAPRRSSTYGGNSSSSFSQAGCMCNSTAGESGYFSQSWYPDSKI